jgi:parallel beta-helix repeat protein
MLFSTPKRLLTPSPKTAHLRKAKSSAFRLEVLEDRTVLSHKGHYTVLTVGVGYEYATISSALAAAPANAIIEVYPGTYNEAVTVTKNGIQLEAMRSGVIIQPTTVAPVTLSGVNVGGAAIDIYADNVVVSGFTVNGSHDTDSNLWAGIRVIEGGSATIEYNTVKGMINGSSNTNVGIQVGTSLVVGNQGGGIASIYGNNIEGYAGAGVLVDGDGGEAGIQWNSITGRGAGNGGISEYGVQVSNGASARIQYNSISGNTIDGYVAGGYNPTPTSAGIFFFNDGNVNSVAALNYLTGNDDGILVQSSNGTSRHIIQIVDNLIQQNYGYAGIFVLSSNSAVVVGNDVSYNSTFNGIALNYSSNVQVDSNAVYKNVNADGIYDFQGSDNQIAWNDAYSNGNNGINVDTTTGDELIYNSTSKNAFNGIQITGGSNNSIWLGSCSVNNQDGILLIDTTGNSVLGNIVSLNGGSGLKLEDAQNTLIAFNTSAKKSNAPISIDSQSTGTTEIYKFNGSPPIVDKSTWANGYCDTFCYTYADADYYVDKLND